MDPAKRAAMADAFVKAFLFIPAGIQGILLFFFMLVSFPRSVDYTNGLIKGLISSRIDNEPLLFYPFNIIITGSLLLTANLLLIRSSQKEKGILGMLYKLFVFAAGTAAAIFLKNNMILSLFDGIITGNDFNCSYLFGFSLPLMFVFAFINGSYA